MEIAKRKIKLDLFIQQGYFLLQYTKLRRLQFYFVLMDLNVDRSDLKIARWTVTGHTMPFLG